MDSRTAVAQKILGFPDARYFDYDEEMELALMDALSEADFQGMAIGAPQQIATEERDELPVILLHQQDGLREWRVDLEKNCALVAVDLSGGEIRMRHAFVDEKLLYAHAKPQAEAEEPEPAPEGEMAEAITSGAFHIDVRGVVNLHWAEGLYALSLVSFNWISNTVIVRLSGPPRPAALRVPQIATLDVAAATLPAYRKTAETPDAPEHGVRFSMQDSLPAHGTELPVYGSFSVPARVAYGLAKEIREAWEASVEEVPVAVVPVSIAILGLDQPTPRQFDFDIPVFAPGTPQPDQPLQGFFGVDLLGSDEEPIAPGVYAVYVFADQFVAGPGQFAVK